MSGRFVFVLASVLTDSQKIALENRVQDLRALPGEHSQAHAAGGVDAGHRSSDWEPSAFETRA